MRLHFVICFQLLNRGKLTQENLFDQFTPVNVAIVNPQTIYNIGESIFQFLSIIVSP